MPINLEARDPLENPAEGDLWHEGSGFAEMIHTVTMVGPTHIWYLYDGGKPRCVWRRWFRDYCERNCRFVGNRGLEIPI